jgi:hypothetical protein
MFSCLFIYVFQSVGGTGMHLAVLPSLLFNSEHH